jgi:hypothetical protein
MSHIVLALKLEAEQVLNEVTALDIQRSLVL